MPPVKFMAVNSQLETYEDGEFEFQSKGLSDLQRVDNMTNSGSFIDQSQKDDILISMTPPVVTFGWQNNQESEPSPKKEIMEQAFGSQRMP